MKRFQTQLPKILLVTVIIFISLQLLNVILGYEVRFNANLAIAFGYTVLYTFSLSYSNWSLFYYLDKVFKDDRFSAKRIAIGLLGSLILTLGVIFLLRVFEEVVVDQRSFREYIANENPLNFVVSVVITIIVAL